LYVDDGALLFLSLDDLRWGFAILEVIFGRPDMEMHVGQVKEDGERTASKTEFVLVIT
jgi:hypothetical protein